MKKKTLIAFVVVSAAVLSVSLPMRALALGLGEKATLQAAMQQHIDENLIDGAYLHLNFETGSVQELYPTASHPMILRMGQYFVLCSEFIRGDGGHYNVDFYLAPRGDGYRVFRAEVENREPLKRLMKLGKADRVD